MSRRARIRAAAAASVALVIGLILASGVIPGTWSMWEAEATNTGSSFAGGWIPAPSGPNAPSLTGATNSTWHMTWTTNGSSAAQPSPNPATGEQLQIADGGSGASASCPATTTSASWKNTGTSVGTGVFAKDDGDAEGTMPVADWWCYQLVSTSATNWTSIAAASFTAVQLMIPTAVVYGNGNVAGTIDKKDTISITFNKNVTTANVTAVCAFPGAAGSGVILIGDATCSTTSDAYTIGKITGLTITGSKTSLSAALNTTLPASTIQVKMANNATSGPTVSGTGTFLASASISGAIGACASASAPNCTTTNISGSF